MYEEKRMEDNKTFIGLFCDFDLYICNVSSGSGNHYSEIGKWKVYQNLPAFYMEECLCLYEIRSVDKRSLGTGGKRV